MKDHTVLVIGAGMGGLAAAIDLARAGCQVTVIEKAAATGVALEINADPHRLDLDWRVLRRARQAGVAVSIGADAHNAAGIRKVDYGVAMARKGWLGPDDVLNALPLDGFLAHAARRRG